MKQTNEYKVYNGFEKGSYNIGSRYMLINDCLIDVKKRTITVVPMSNEELNKLKDKLEYAVENNLTILMEDNYL